MKTRSSYDPRIHHRRSIRLKDYDYSKAGLYFVTMCCQDRVCLFGHVEDGIMILNEAGKVAEECWLEIPKHYPKVVLHDFVIMPNHVHGIIELKDESPIEGELPDGASFPSYGDIKSVSRNGCVRIRTFTTFGSVIISSVSFEMVRLIMLFRIIY